ncbi:uncharacterized protein LOC130784282 isoform X2 [Actinidia eriantha]|uniref:uncharacterized protein LOC130784282 isoform X2 n=1 Tax=Actinidia eriantha TaxID=165200 RepID=UPI00258C73ED|nr:uncharacterized protein LOC130784282 isoform X2 [Actinidia eriantha]
MAKPRKQLFFNACSVLMALLFALSASVQFNDPGIAGFWSLDMRERVVREKFGSGLVISSMFLQLQASSIPISYNPTKGHRVDVTKHVKYGMVGLVGIGYGLSYGFFMFQKKEMKF